MNNDALLVAMPQWMIELYRDEPSSEVMDLIYAYATLSLATSQLVRGIGDHFGVKDGGEIPRNMRKLLHEHMKSRDVVEAREWEVPQLSE